MNPTKQQVPNNQKHQEIPRPVAMLSKDFVTKKPQIQTMEVAMAEQTPGRSKSTLGTSLAINDTHYKSQEDNRDT
jgi:hypothetical protein